MGSTSVKGRSSDGEEKLAKPAITRSRANSVFNAMRVVSFLIIFVLGTVAVPAQKTDDYSLDLSRRNPDTWFSLLIPKIFGNVERHADVDGGFYSSKSMAINFDYWTNEGTPNFLRNARRQYSRVPFLACPESAIKLTTNRTLIAGRKAVVQSCRQEKTIGGNTFSYLYNVTFPNSKVFDGEQFKHGVFNLTVYYKNPSDQVLASRIIQSIRLFDKQGVK
jgi:hypothetical protein